jgi:hypothetical protein
MKWRSLLFQPINTIHTSNTHYIICRNSQSFLAAFTPKNFAQLPSIRFALFMLLLPQWNLVIEHFTNIFSGAGNFLSSEVYTAAIFIYWLMVASKIYQVSKYWWVTILQIIWCPKLNRWGKHKQRRMDIRLERNANHNSYSCGLMTMVKGPFWQAKTRPGNQESPCTMKLYSSLQRSKYNRTRSYPITPTLLLWDRFLYYTRIYT